MNKRRWLTAGVALGAGVLGAGWGWWRLRGSAPAAGALNDLWQQSWQTPQGEPLPMTQFQGRPLLLNFWATWCPPCVQELPMLDAFYQQQRGQGWQVLGLAVDQPTAVRKFLGQHPLAFPVAIAGLDGTELSQRLGNDAGGLPFSVLFGKDGTVLDRHLGQLKPEDLERWRQRV